MKQKCTLDLEAVAVAPPAFLPDPFGRPRPRLAGDSPSTATAAARFSAFFSWFVNKTKSVGSRFQYENGRERGGRRMKCTSLASLDSADFAGRPRFLGAAASAIFFRSVENSGRLKGVENQI